MGSMRRVRGMFCEKHGTKDLQAEKRRNWKKRRKDHWTEYKIALANHKTGYSLIVTGVSAWTISTALNGFLSQLQQLVDYLVSRARTRQAACVRLHRGEARRIVK